MRRWFVIAISSALMGLGLTAHAYPTLFGPTGGAALPTADVVPPGQVDIAADYYNSNFKPTYPVRAIIGLGSGFEFGGLYSFNSFANIWGVNAKYAYRFNCADQLALGALYNKANNADTHATQAYLVYTHNFNSEAVVAASVFRATLGVNWTEIGDEITTDNGFRGFIGADFTIWNRLEFSGEWQSKISDIGERKDLASFVARYAFTPQISAQVGVTNADPFTGVAGSDSERIFAGLEVGFGGPCTNPCQPCPPCPQPCPPPCPPPCPIPYPAR